jgi:hypothetical protein
MSRLRIQQRTRIYLGCEGQSEQSYGARLGQIADAVGLHLYFDSDVLQPGGGDPLALVRLAIRRIREKEAKRGIFAFRAILLDCDKMGAKRERDAQIGQLSSRNRLHLIWQEPCHEGFLLRHLDGHQTARPITSDLAEQTLKSVWAEYQKAMPAVRLATRIDLQAVRRACSVEAALAVFLNQIGFTPNL